MKKFLLSCTLLFCHLLPCAHAQDYQTSTIHSLFAPKGTWGEQHYMLGMVSLHTDPYLLKHGNWNNFLVGYSTEHLYFGAFRNTFNKWSVGVGLQRFFFERHLAHQADIKMGYRLGALYGYDERLIKFAKHTKTIPFFLPFVDLQYQRVGLEFQYFVHGVAVGMYCQLD